MRLSRMAAWLRKSFAFGTCSYLSGAFPQASERSVYVCWRTDRFWFGAHASNLLAFCQRGDIMKRNAIRTRPSAELPVVWNEAEFAATWKNITDTCDDRVSEDIFDAEDEHAEVDIIVRGMDHGAN
jgi:hypothetical protein